MNRGARHVTISGRVQGVAFRWATSERARSLGVVGWVRNLVDGRVEAWIEAEDPSLERMLAFLHEGPAHATVSAVDVRECEPQGFPGFEIRRNP